MFWKDRWKKDVKLIKHTGGVNDPDDPSYPWLLEVELSPPELMIITYIAMYGGREEIVVRGKTRKALEKFVEEYELLTHPRLRKLTITGPEQS